MSHRKTKRAKKVAWKMDDTDWQRIEAVFPVKEIGPEDGRPPASNRRVFEALIRFCRAGCPWEEMPKNFPSWSTCRRRLIEWEEQGVLVSVHQHLLALLDEQGKLRMEEAFLDGTFVPARYLPPCKAREGATRSEKQRSARVR